MSVDTARRIYTAGPTGVGQSAFQAWLALGNTGSLDDFVASLKGKDGLVRSVNGKSDGNIKLTGADIGLATADAAAAGSDTVGLMTPDLTRRLLIASLAATAAGTVGGALAATTGLPAEVVAACNNPAADLAEIARRLAKSYTSWTLPPGTYYLKSRKSPVAPVVYQNSTCLLFVGLVHFRIYAYGCTFVIDNSISGPDASHLNSATSHVGFQGDCKHCAWEGGVLVGNRAGLPDSQVNNGIWASSVTDLTIRNVEGTGDFYNGSLFTGTFIFDSLIEGLRCRSVALGLDLAWHEGLTVRDCRLAGGNSIGSTGISTFTDPNTKNDNVTTTSTGTRRTLAGGISNAYRVEGNTVEGFDTGIRIDGVNKWRVTGNTPRNCRRDVAGGVYAGILVQNGAETIAAALYTQDGLIEGNEVYGNGSASASSKGGGVVFSTGGQPIVGTVVRGNKIYDNLRYGVAQSGDTNLSLVEMTGNDGTSRNASGTQTDLVEPQLQTDLGPQLVARDNRLGYNPVPTGSSYPGVMGTRVLSADGKTEFVCTAPNRWQKRASGLTDF